MLRFEEYEKLIREWCAENELAWDSGEICCEFDPRPVTTEMCSRLAAKIVWENAQTSSDQGGD